MRLAAARGVTICFADLDGAEGLWIPEDRTILVDQGLAEQRVNEVLEHELQHVDIDDGHAAIDAAVGGAPTTGPAARTRRWAVGLTAAASLTLLSGVVIGLRHDQKPDSTPQYRLEQSRPTQSPGPTPTAGRTATSARPTGTGLVHGDPVVHTETVTVTPSTPAPPTTTAPAGAARTTAKATPKPGVVLTAPNNQAGTNPAPTVSPTPTLAPPTSDVPPSEEPPQDDGGSEAVIVP